MTTLPRHLLKLLVLLAICLAAQAGCGSDGTDSDPKASTGSGGGSGGGLPMGCDPLGPELAPGTAPSARGDMNFAFDPECNRVFLFMGDAAAPVMCGFAASEFLSDGYTYDVATGIWSEISVASDSPLPTVRARGRGVWDEARNRMVIFGGRYRDGTAGPYTFLNDVWAFDPATVRWEELSPQDAAGAPSGRMSPSMDADPDRDRLVIHGGGEVDANFTAFVAPGGTFAFDLESNSWSEIGANGAPPPRLFHSSAIDRQRGRLFVFAGGGVDAFQTFFRDMWYLDFASDTWTEVPVDPGTFPAGRIKQEMELDAARDRIVLYGGHDDTQLGNNSQVYQFDLNSLSWTLLKEGDVYQQPAIAFCDFPVDFASTDLTSPERRESHLFAISGDLAVMYGGRTDCGLARDTWELDLTTITWEQIVESPTGMTCRRSGSQNCDDSNARMCI